MRLACLSNHGCRISGSLWRRLRHRWFLSSVTWGSWESVRWEKERMSSAALLIPLIPHSGSVSLASRLLREASCPAALHNMHYTCTVCAYTYVCVCVHVKLERTRKWRGSKEMLPCWMWLPVECVFSAFSHSSECITPQCFITSVWMLCFRTFCILLDLWALKA